jgi:Right handed beta helix region
MAPANKGGSDAHTGLSQSSAVLTLARVQQVLEQRKPAGDVVVRIDQGNYVAGQTTWTYYVPGHTISFMPINYVLGHGRPANGDPAFIDSTHGNSHTAGWWFQAQLPAAKTNPLHNGGNTGLRFYYLRIEYYTNGISFDGQSGHVYENSAKPPMYIKPSAGLNTNMVSGMSFQDIGDKYATGQTGFGAILLTDSSGNDITNNTFDQIENTAASIGQLHGLYVTHFSDYNTITLNLFESITAEAVKVRDRSDYNIVEHNRFEAIGGAADYLDEFCNLACAQANPGTPRQCASYGNRFFYNTIGTVFGGTAEQNAWALNPAGLTYAGGSGCSIPAGQQRVFTGGNT